MPDSRTLIRPHLIVLGGIAAAFAGSIVCILIPVLVGVGLQWWPSVQLIAYMIASMSIAGVVGFIFGVPRVRTDLPASGAGTRQSRFEANSNLEQISDWLTKLLVGAGLVQLAVLPGFLRKLGDYLGGSLGFDGGPPASVAIVLYGAGVGFVVLYLWARLRLRIMLEQSEVLADQQWLERPVIEERLQLAEEESNAGKNPDEVSRTLDRVEAIVRTSSGLDPVLWVDDYPENNVDVAAALRSAGVEIVEALSTDAALAAFERRRFGLVITDLGRREHGEDVPMAGLQLIETLINYLGSNSYRRVPPIVVFAGPRGLEHKAELLEAGATRVTTSPTELFEFALITLSSGLRRGSSGRRFRL